MEKKAMAWKTKGMNRDLSVSSFNSEFVFENRNLRLATKEGNTLMSWVNERGTKEIYTYVCDENSWAGETGENKRRYEIKPLEGTPIGTAVLNDKLVVFTHRNPLEGESNPRVDRIYVLYGPASDIEVTEDGIEKTYYAMKAFSLYCGNLGFSFNHPLETLASYEADHIQKVYWTDGLNQPRVINIAVLDCDADGSMPGSSSKKLRRWNNQADFEGSYDGKVQTFFDFVPAVKLDETMDVTQEVTSSGTFAPGVIQYCFTYINKYGQETNIIDVSPLFYLTHEDRGAAADETKVTCSFTINIIGLDTSFDAVRLYSIQRSSWNGTPAVKEVSTIYYSSTSHITYIDNGTTGATIDPWKLLYVGGKEITAMTMAEKSQTLFLGNIEEKNLAIDDIQDYFDVKANKPEIQFLTGGSYKTIKMEEASGMYPFSLSTKQNQRKITTFKGGETYRFGFQLQNVTGEWSQPIFLDDVKNNLYPDVKLYNTSVGLVYAQSDITLPECVDKSVYKRIRPVVVYPNIQDRTILCQGVLNPTVFNAMNRKRNYLPFSQASWYFRPYMAATENSNISMLQPYMTRQTLGINEYNELEDGLTDGERRSAYILVGMIYRSDVLANIRLEKCVTFKHYKNGILQETREHPITGIIYLGDIQDGEYNSKVYAFISNDNPWKDGASQIPPTSFGKSIGNYDRNLSGDSYVAGSKGNNGLKFFIATDLGGAERTHQIYNGLTFDDKFEPWPSSFKNDYAFKCQFSNNYFAVTFHYPLSTAGGQVAGSAVEFNHYMPIHAESDAISLDDNNQITEFDLAAAYETEIMGSVNVYDIWKNTQLADANDFNTNTQFFVDQSIVTLNSPDIEFDTQVQVFGGDNLHLRIVGAIPITATRSSHAITLKGNMLETKHGVNSKIDTNDYNFGEGEIDYNVKYENISTNAGRRLVAQELWNDVIVAYDTDSKSDDHTKTDSGLVNYIIHPWHRDTSLNNDFSRTYVSSEPESKKESNMLFSYNTEYINNIGSQISYKNINAKIMLTENSHVSNYRLPKPLPSMSEINYYPNVDTVLFNKKKYVAMWGTGKDVSPKYSLNANTTVDNALLVNGPVSMKYKSTSHAVIALGRSEGEFNSCVGVLPNGLEVGNGDNGIPIGKTPRVQDGEKWVEQTLTPFWGDTITFHQEQIDLRGMFMNGNTHVAHNYLWLGELFKEVTNRFGGDSREAIRHNNWMIAGPTVKLKNGSNAVRLAWTDGDTYYQRYDCLKTYPFTKEDPNQLVEILSFMCETHVNIDGRYDKHRGSTVNHLMDPTVFNLMNDVYSQQNNYFPIQQIDTEDYRNGLKYPNRAWFSMTHASGADVDEWTNVVTSSTVEFDGSKGQLNAIRRLGDNLIAFQDTGISQILYNEQVQISTEQGVPIEISNSKKVQGVRYISNTIGCSNKWSMVNTPSGIYFIDSYNKDIYLFTGQLANLSQKGGFDSWCKQNFKAGRHWTPTNFDKDYVGYYDPVNQDVLFISAEEALAYSEKIGSFTSFYSYGNTPFFCHVGDTSIWVKPYGSTTKLWEHQQGEYCKFFDTNAEYSTTLIANDSPTLDKIFTNLEFRACVESKEADSITQNKDLSILPFDTLDSWNEYQKGTLNLGDMHGHASMRHYWENDAATIKRKFRIWRCDIPRDGRNRMRNPWLYLKLTKDAASPDNYLNKTELHDFIVTYFS